MEKFKYNKVVKYKAGAHYHPKHYSLSTLTIYVNPTQSFTLNVIDPLKDYLNPDMKSDAIMNTWMSNPMKCYQNQLNFCVWAATTGCGISFADHLNHSNPMIQTVYRFHVYFQVRKMLRELKVPLKHEHSHDAFNNPIDLRAYERICNEFDISTRIDWRQKMDKNKGMGNLYMYAVGNLYDGAYIKGITSFQHNTRVRLLYVRQSHNNAWTTFILDTSNGFTQAGVERLNQSIRSFVWVVMAAQAETRTNIVSTSNRFDAQKQFLSNVEDAIDARENIPNMIDRYQNYLRYARSKVNFCIGISLYMIPADLQLQVGTITNYNNKIVVADSSMNLGKNDINHTLNTVNVSHVPQNIVQVPSQVPAQVTNSHEHTKNSLTIGLVTIGLMTLYFSKI